MAQRFRFHSFEIVNYTRSSAADDGDRADARATEATSTIGSNITAPTDPGATASPTDPRDPRVFIGEAADHAVSELLRAASTGDLHELKRLHARVSAATIRGTVASIRLGELVGSH